MLNGENWFFLLLLVVVIMNFEEVSFQNEKNIGVEDTLVMSHVLFRHGHRTPDSVELYPNDPYINETYFPYGRGQLTKVGKQKLYVTGKSLRKRYQKFLGKYYYPGIAESATTDYQRTKVSLQLVLAGLFPPAHEEIWESSLSWQPIPYNYIPKDKDKVLLGTLCPRYLELYENITISKEVQAEFDQDKNIFEYISINSGLSVTSYLDVYNLYFGLSTEDDMGLALPLWTKDVWPQIITNLATKEYFISMSTQEMRQIATGYFFKKIIEDTRMKILSNNKEGSKIYLYSAHENNIAQLLMALDVFDPHVPKYGSYVLLEVHYIENVFGFKIYYENYKDTDGPKLLKIPMCQEFCSLEAFAHLIKDIIPVKDLC